MYQKLVFCIFLVLFPVAMVVAQDESSPGAGDTDAKMVSGMSILGNKEAPMSLVIVPWKTSELGAETNLTRTLNERHVAVDREVFSREVAFYEVSAGGKSRSASSQVVSLQQH